MLCTCLWTILLGTSTFAQASQPAARSQTHASSSSSASIPTSAPHPVAAHIPHAAQTPAEAPTAILAASMPEPWERALPPHVTLPPPKTKLHVPDALVFDPKSIPLDEQTDSVPKIVPDTPPRANPLRVEHDVDAGSSAQNVPNLWPVLRDEYMPSSRGFPQGSPYRNLGDYDWKLTRRVLRETGATPKHDAEDVLICDIEVFTHDIFLPEEPFPLFLNALHATTRSDALEPRLPIQPGDRYSILLGEDIREQLHNPEVYSSVVVVPVENKEKACVDLYVITRDLWSLRVGFKPQISGGTLEKLELSIVETNFLGLNDTLGVGFAMDQGSWEIGPVWKPTWPFGLNVDIIENFRLIFDREFGGFDGVRNELRIERPFRSSWERNAWYIDTDIRDARKRVFDGRQIHTATVDDPDTGESYRIDERWREFRLKADGGYVRSWGLTYKTLVTVGAFIDMRTVRAEPMDDRIPEPVLDIFAKDRLPRQERAMGPLVKWEWYSNRYFHLTNYERFEVSESYKKGIHLTAELRYSDPVFGADVRFIDGTLGARYVAPMGEDAFADFAAMGRIRWGAHGFVDRRLEFSHRLVLPSGPLGRFVLRGWARILRNDTANERFRIGAAEGLRGERGHVAEGRNAWIANMEWRSKPVEILSTFWGLAAFIDMGSAWERHTRAETYASVGAGIRFMAPQAMALPAAVDIAWPIGHGIWRRGIPSPVISLHFGQIFEPKSELKIDEFYQ